MASVNKAIIIGNLGRDPETRYMPDGGATTSLSVATTEKWKDKAGATQEKTEWHRVVLFGKVAEIAGEYLKKGSSVYIEGRIQTRKYQDRDGHDKYIVEIVGQQMQMLGPRSSGGPGEPAQQRSDADVDKDVAGARAEDERRRQAGGGKFADFEDDIPF